MEVAKTLRAVDEWVKTEDAWMLSVEAETLAWK